MAGGSRKNHDCDMERTSLEAQSNPMLEGVYFVFIAFDNLSNLPFVVQFQTVKEFVSKAVRKITNRNAK